ncbi:zinc finger protein 346 isoform X14 [Choloepus didactylus]|uniref:zinc finger protein 346 isoform X14 n=1 Tax=Choloepus didactylus TaxID=27675 RepID=UPI0018A05BE5|nr:zinc finger protein 346 isoform X14 [Choloepus didactylus]
MGCASTARGRAACGKRYPGPNRWGGRKSAALPKLQDSGPHPHRLGGPQTLPRQTRSRGLTEEVEHMIQKNQCLFTNTQCKVCCALLISESQKLAHYQSKKHANKVKRYLAIHGMETLKGETKKLDSDQKSSRSKDKNQCCPICNMTFSSPVVAQSHYLGKTHAKNLKLKQQSTKVEAGKGYPCKTCKIVLNSIEQYQAHVSGFKHKNQSPKAMTSPLGQIPIHGQTVQKDSTTSEV